MSETGPVFFYEPEFYMLSNFSAHAFFFKGIFYPTAEHAYQAGKFHDEHDKAHIQGAISPSIAKKRSKSRQADIGLRCTPEFKLQLMEDVLWAKIRVHREVRDTLLATGDREIIENSPTDSFWGWGPDRQGQNHLGKIWMKIRAEIQQAQPEEKEGVS
jgi:ribA/ribD-fused uncharacterized protein